MFTLVFRGCKPVSVLHCPLIPANLNFLVCTEAKRIDYHSANPVLAADKLRNPLFRSSTGGRPKSVRSCATITPAIGSKSCECENVNRQRTLLAHFQHTGQSINDKQRVKVHISYLKYISNVLLLTTFKVIFPGKEGAHRGGYLICRYLLVIWECRHVFWIINNNTSPTLLHKQVYKSQSSMSC